MSKYFVRTGSEKVPTDTIALVPNDNLLTGTKNLSDYFGKPTTLENDLMLLASAVFAADRATKRGEREDVCRSIELMVPVVNFATIAPLIDEIQSTLRSLSNDVWQITLRQRPGKQESCNVPGSNGGKTILFSGGLDSLAAAIENGKVDAPLELVSNYTHNSVTAGAQKNLAKMLNAAGYHFTHRRFFISSRSGRKHELEHDEESSQRTRSFLFLMLGAIVARRTGNHEVLLLAENGQLAIHLPLTQGRIGAFSTHTAHPDVIASMERVLSTLLGIEITIQNPFVHFTKKEVVEIVYARLPVAIPVSTSCFMNWRLPAGFTHCGACVPCFIRRIAIESLGPDKTKYARDVWRDDVLRLDPADDGRRNLMDLLEFIVFLEQANDEEVMNEFPELYSPNFDAQLVISMYRRFCAEARKVFNSYPCVRGLLDEN
jgi:7-cyano-7-deazaguanine synthase in queuosine biosynthesis